MAATPTLAERLRACAEDPMWADHAEVPKRWCAEAADAVERLDWATNLLTRATTLLRQWETKYGDQQPPWLPPAECVELAEDVDKFLRPSNVLGEIV
ncbi:MAG: hypothetical protein QM750_04430 [Rubrivivax sp.]